MTVIDTNSLKPGITIVHNDRIMEVVDYNHVKPGKGGAFVRCKLRDVLTGQVIENTWKGFQKIEQAVLRTVPMEFLFRDGGQFCFMDPETYDQVAIDEDMIGESAKFLKENLACGFVQHEGQTISVKLPDFVEVAITQTDPGVRGDTASGGSKPATVETGAVVKVPLFLQEGDIIKLDTRDGSYVERVRPA